MLIFLFLDEQERIQRKTFVNWINSYLSKRKPQMKVENLIDDLKDGVKLLALLEVLSGERLPMERGRVLRRPHYLSNCNTALEFLRSKRVSQGQVWICFKWALSYIVSKIHFSNILTP